MVYFYFFEDITNSKMTCITYTVFNVTVSHIHARIFYQTKIQLCHNHFEKSLKIFQVLEIGIINSITFQNLYETWLV